MCVWACAIVAQLLHRALTVVAVVLWCFAIRLPSKGRVMTTRALVRVHVQHWMSGCVSWMMQGGELLLQQ